MPGLDTEFQFTRPRGVRRASRPPERRLLPFQFTRPRGVRRASRPPERRLLPFQFTRPRGARRALSVRRRCPSGFNSRAREGRDRRFCSQRGASIRFQFTRPRGARQTLRCYPRRTDRRFNSRAREGRDVDALSRLALICVSIHAPARGATPRDKVHLNGTGGVSIHAPARGATLPIPAIITTPCCFNSRAREGRDSCAKVRRL